MALVAGLAPQNLRLAGPEEPALPDAADIIIENADKQTEDVPIPDEDGHVLKIEHGDGSVTVSLDGMPLIGIDGNQSREPNEWFDNLGEDISTAELGRISSDLLRGINDDIESRSDWIDARKDGLKLLGLKIEIPGLQGASDGAPVEGMSKIRHPLLLEAVLRFQANARSEMLPTDGPVKIRNDDNDADLTEDELANALEMDLNHYLTSVATEYYPDSDRMYLMLGFGGTAFKKVYNCPLRNRPVSETVDADDLIVNNNATDLRNAKRITHRVLMRPSTVKRLQILGVYRDVHLSTPNAPKMDNLQREEKEIQGLSVDVTNPDDRDREIYECYCELDIQGFEHTHKGKITGLEIPYRVTIDVTSREILSIVRNYDEDTEELPVARANFVKYTYVPGVGFYDIGLLNILGNTTNAITAAWRELLDAGMYSNFPGFLMADTGARQNTNIFRVPPGGGALVKTGGLPINQAIMPLPYQPPSQALMSLVTDIAQTGMRIGGTSEQQVGEGRADAPVGTTIAMIEQATKIMNAVHKRMHAAQAEEFKLLIQCFKENPEAFWQRKCKSTKKWDEQTFLKAIEDCELVPQADPNTASHGQRVMKIMALKQLQASNPNLFDPIAVDTAALHAIGWSNPQQFFVSPDQQAKPPPQLQQMMAKMANEKQAADAKMIEANSKVAEVKAKMAETQLKAMQETQKAKESGVAGGNQQIDTQADMMQAHAKLMDAQTKRAELGVKHHDAEDESRNRQLDRQSREQVQLLELARDIMLHPSNTQDVGSEVDSIAKKVGVDKG